MKYQDTLLQIHFHRIVKGPGTSLQSSKLNQKMLEMSVVIYTILWQNFTLILARIQKKLSKKACTIHKSPAS